MARPRAAVRCPGPWLAARSSGDRSDVEAGAVHPAVIPIAQLAAEHRTEQRHQQDGHQRDDAGRRRGALVDRDPRQVQLLQHVVLRSEDGAHAGEHENHDEADQPHGQPLAGAVEAGHPARHVPPGEGGEEQGDPDGDGTPQPPRVHLGHPPPSPTVSTWLTASSAVSTPRARPSARPAADSSAIRMTASPLADSQPKNAAPHLRPPKRTRWATTASRAVPRVADAPSVRSEPPPVRTGTVWSTCVWSWCVRSLPTIVGLLRAGFSAVVPPCSGRCACPAVTWLIGVRGPVARLGDHSGEVGAVTVLLVDVANVVGSRPDGWWRDRAGATGRLLDRLAGLPGATLAGPDGAPLPVGEVVAVVEGAARDVPAPDGGRGVGGPGRGG